VKKEDYSNNTLALLSVFFKPLDTFFFVCLFSGCVLLLALGDSSANMGNESFKCIIAWEISHSVKLEER
jgi:hypothetical protein